MRCKGELIILRYRKGWQPHLTSLDPKLKHFNQMEFIRHISYPIPYIHLRTFSIFTRKFQNSISTVLQQIHVGLLFKEEEIHLTTQRGWRYRQPLVHSLRRIEVGYCLLSKNPAPSTSLPPLTLTLHGMVGLILPASLLIQLPSVGWLIVPLLW